MNLEDVLDHMNIWYPDKPTLAAAEKVLRNPRSNPWVFAGDARHFGQFGTAADWEVLMSFTDEEFSVVFGEWGDEEWEMAHRASWVR